MSGGEPDYVHLLSSGAQPTDDVIGPHPLELEQIDQQMWEMELARAAAAVACRDYLIVGGAGRVVAEKETTP